MAGIHYDEETGISTIYHSSIEGIRVDLNDSWCPGAPISLYIREWWTQGRRTLLCGTVDCAKELLWTPRTRECLWDGVEIGYWVGGYMRYEMLATDKEADEIASRAVYDGQNEAHMEITHELSVGTSTVWIRATQYEDYRASYDVDVRLCVEFANSEDCTRFLHEDMTELKDRFVHDDDGDVAVIGDIMRALLLIWDDRVSARIKAVGRRIPYSQLADEYPQPETQIIRHRASNRGNYRPCFLTLHLSIQSFYYISRVEWSATNSPSTFPSSSGAFRSLNNLHLEFPSHASQHRNLSHQGDLTVTISAREISFSTGNDSVSLGNGFTLNSQHRTVTVNYINGGDAFLGTINGGNVGGRNNVNTIRISSPVASRSPRILPTPPLQRQMESQGGVGRRVRPRPSGPRPLPNGSTPRVPLLKR